VEEPVGRAEDARRVERRTVAVIFALALALCALLTKSHVTGWNDGSRFATIDALTADHTFAIDASPFAVGLGDEIRFGGTTYSDKPPLLPLLGAAVAVVLAPLGITLRHTPSSAIYLITLLTVGVSFAAGCAYAYAFARLLGYDLRLAAAVAALTGAGTLALPYATVLANHVPCGAAGLAGTYHLVRARNGAVAQAAAAGALFGLAYAFDAAGAVFAVTGVVLLWGAPLARWLLCVVAGLPFLVLQLAYNLRISGSVLPTVFNARVWSDPSLPLHSWSSQVFAVYSPADYARIVADLLVGTKGLLAFTPLMLVAGYGFAVMLRTPGTPRQVAIAVLATFGVYFALIVFLQNDAGARNFGERRYVDLFFVLGIGFGPALASVRGAVSVAAVRLAIVASVAIAALGTVLPFGGDAGESGFAFAGAAFAALARRAPVQAALDIVLLIAILALLMRLVPLPATRAPQRA
jgi:hypothetical protein